MRAKFCVTKFKYHEEGLRILGKPRGGMAQNWSETAGLDVQVQLDEPL